VQGAVMYQFAMYFFLFLPNQTKKNCVMNFDDKESQEFEKKFNILLKEIEEKLTPEKAEDIRKSLETLVQNLEPFLKKPDKTAEEIQLVNKIKPQIKELYEKLLDMHIVLGEKVFRNSMGFYENVKKAAASGDPQAQKIFNEMDPLYKEMLAAQIGKN
jgi:N-acetylglucosamine kinase-like BadF-type ATPase